MLYHKAPYQVKIAGEVHFTRLVNAARRRGYGINVIAYAPMEVEADANHYSAPF
jgi:hypothetical protein